MDDRPITRGLAAKGGTPAKKTLARQLRSAMTPSEAAVWSRLRNNNQGIHFRRQQVIDGFVADFYCLAAGLVIEIDGSVHDSQAEYDEIRERIITARNLTFVRFTNDEVDADLPGVVNAIMAACRPRNRATERL